MFNKIFENMQKNTPIIHTITNYVTVNDCANIILATGGSPIMSDEIDDIAEILSFSKALVINIGTLNKRTVESMIYAGKEANRLNIPVILDPVGIGATSYRNLVVDRLLENVEFSVIKGNVSELKFLTTRINSSNGVDVLDEDIITENNLDDNVKSFKKLSKDTGAIIAATGVIDIITNEDKTYIVKNGSSYMGKITGAGCMLGCVIASFVSVNCENVLEATTFAVSSFGIAGEYAESHCKGSGSFKVKLMDYVSNFDYNKLKEGMKVENY